MNTQDTQQEQEIHLSDYLAILRRRFWSAFLFFVIVVATVTAGSFYMTPIYKATTTLLIDLESPNVLTSTGSVALQSQNYYSYKDYFQSQKEILTSRGLIERVFDEFGLADTEDYLEAKDPLEKFTKTIKAEPIRDTRLLNLSVENKDPVLASKIANRVSELYVLRNLYYISRDEIMNLLKNEYLKLEARLTEYSKIYKDKHPKMIRLKEEMQELVNRIEGVKLLDFTYEIDKASTPEQKQAHALQGLKANNVSIQDYAKPPIKPDKPKKLLNILLALAIGAFGGIGMAFFFEYLDDVVRDYNDLERIVQWPLLGGIPRMKVSGLRLTEFKKDKFTHLKPKEPVSEAYRCIRTSVFFASTQENPLRAMLVTSPGPQEGKTTTLCNLGIVMAQAGKKVLLVDADMRKPRIHGIFKHKNLKGISDFLSMQSGIDSIINPTDIENLSFVSAGTAPPNPSELLSSHKVKEFIDTAKKKFDIILFDTPPCAIVTDAIILSRAVDGAIMVIESGRTSKRALPRIFKLFKDANAKVIGAILNRISPATSNYYHYYHYKSYYGKK
jgi:capsular exopolysaccharide synthesis family protein